MVRIGTGLPGGIPFGRLRSMIEVVGTPYVCLPSLRLSPGIAGRFDVGHEGLHGKFLTSHWGVQYNFTVAVVLP